MIRAYDEYYLEKARVALGRMLDFAVYDLGYALSDFWDLFLCSSVAKRFERGESSLLVGKSGIEIAYEVLGNATERVTPKYTFNRSEEYWAGWALAYYQWETGLSFETITQAVSIEEIQSLYSPYHEMDIRQFCDRMNELYRAQEIETNLKRLRKRVGLSQSQLSKESAVPLRTIQQYEQKRKSINKAQAEYVINLAKALYCEPSDLLERE